MVCGLETGRGVVGACNYFSSIRGNEILSHGVTFWLVFGQQAILNLAMYLLISKKSACNFLRCPMKVNYVPISWKIVLALVSTFSFSACSEMTKDSSLPPLVETLPTVSFEDFDSLFEETKRWGEFGAEDQLGALNLVSEQKRIEAAAEVQIGRAISLANPMSKTAVGDFIIPLEHEVFVFPQLPNSTPAENAAGDIMTINYHGALHSHMDGVAHFGWKGKLYNGFDFLPGENGFAHAGVENIASTGIFSRGVIVDFPSLYGMDWLPPDTKLTTDHFEAWEAAHGVKIEAGDILLVRTGRWQLASSSPSYDPLTEAAGLHTSVGLWLKSRGISAIGSDAVSDAVPSGVEGVFNPIHVLANAALGMPIFDHLQLDELAEVAEEQGRVTFLFTATPLNIEGATGSPLTPIAVF